MEKAREEILYKYAVIILAVCFCFGFSLAVNAAESIENGDNTERLAVKSATLGGVLQYGDLLEPDDGVSAAAIYRSGDALDSVLPNGLDAFKNKIDISGCGYIYNNERLVNDLERFLNENPRYFYIKPSFSYSYNPHNGNVQSLIFEFTDSIEHIRQQVEEYNAMAEEIVRLMDPGWSSLEKALFINDYLAANCRYDKAAAAAPDPPANWTEIKAYNAYGALVDQKAVCQGYSLAFRELAGRAGLICEMVTSKGLNHAWNMVHVGCSWYHVDSTWNSASPPVKITHNYFLKSTGWFKESGRHNSNDYVYTGGLIDNCAGSEGFDSALWNNVSYVFGYYNGYWYTNTGDKIMKYEVSDNGMRAIEEVVSGVSDRGFSLFLGRIYYQKGDIIYSEDLTNQSEVSERTSSGGSSFYVRPDGYLVCTDGFKMQIHRHEFGEWRKVLAPTCTGEGRQRRVCSICSVGREERMIAALGHECKSWRKTQEASFVKTGLKMSICGRCKKAITRSIPKLPCKRNDQYTAGKYRYKILSPKINGKGTVILTGMTSSASKVTVGGSVKIKGARFKIVQIGNRAFKNKKKIRKAVLGENVRIIGREAFAGDNKLASVTIKSKKLNKVGKKAFKNISRNAFINVPKSKRTKYRALLKNKGQKKSVRVR